MKGAIVVDGVVANVIMISTGYRGPAINIDDLPVQIGDTYDGAKFFHDGLPISTGGAEAELADMRAALELLGVTPAESEATE